MVDRDALSSRQPSRLIEAGRAPRRRPQAPRHRKWGAAFVGLLLASGAGVYTYRQFIHPVPDAEDTAPDATEEWCGVPKCSRTAAASSTTAAAIRRITTGPPTLRSCRRQNVTGLRSLDMLNSRVEKVT